MLLPLLLLLLLLLCLLLTAVTVGFEQQQYMGLESSKAVELAVVLTEGTLDTDVQFKVSIVGNEADLAIGKHMVHVRMYVSVCMYVHISVRVCFFVHIFVHVHNYVCIFMCVCMYLCTYY